MVTARMLSRWLLNFSHAHLKILDRRQLMASDQGVTHEPPIKCGDVQGFYIEKSLSGFTRDNHPQPGVTEFGRVTRGIEDISE
jgi:hypothetical protein